MEIEFRLWVRTRQRSGRACKGLLLKAMSAAEKAVMKEYRKVGIAARLCSSISMPGTFSDFD